jgi:hypothetical protein
MLGTGRTLLVHVRAISSLSGLPLSASMSHHAAGNGAAPINFHNNHFTLQHPQHQHLLLHNPHSDPTSEQDADADADADEDMSYLPDSIPTIGSNPSIAVHRSQKIDLQAVDPVLYGLRRSVGPSRLTNAPLAPHTDALFPL